ncbi:MAG: flippase activity-associated protein Agl23 [Verrucomicrobiota bacterium]
MMNLRSFVAVVIFLIALVIGAHLRLTRLDHRPMHLDEAIQGMKFGELIEKGDFQYDPHDFHGPVLLYSTLPLAWLSGASELTAVSEKQLRLVPALYGVGCLLLLLWGWRALGALEAALAALLVALSPILVFYSRYFIMEMPLVFLVSVAMLSLWSYARRPSYLWAILFGVVGGLAHATKETGAISFFCFGLALILLSIFDRQCRRTVLQQFVWKHWLVGLVCGLLVSALAFTVCFKNPWAAVESVLTYFKYADRADGVGHEKPWHYYIQTLIFSRADRGPIWSEGLIVFFGLAGIVLSFTRLTGDRRIVWRFLSIYTVSMAVIYSFIPYKTPWSMLSWVFSLALLAGFAIASLFSLRGRKRWLAGITLLIAGFGLWHGWGQNALGIDRYRADERNPFVYGHTSTDVARLVQQVNDLSALHPDGKEMAVNVYNEDFGWPLPWYWRDFSDIGFWPEVPENPRSAPVVLVSETMDAEVAESLEETHYSRFFGLRPGMTLVIYIENDLWKKLIESRTTRPAVAG